MNTGQQEKKVLIMELDGVKYVCVPASAYRFPEDKGFQKREALKNVKKNPLFESGAKPRSEGTKIVFDWSKATLEDVPVDWMPEVGQQYWWVYDGIIGGPKKHDVYEGVVRRLRLFPTAALAQQYLDSQNPAERWEPKCNEEYFYIGSNGEVKSACYDNQTEDHYKRCCIGNCFQTKEVGESVKNRLVEILSTRVQ